jgi:CheY-like chemotaxis protein
MSAEGRAPSLDLRQLSHKVMAASLSNLQNAPDAHHSPRARPLILVADDDDDTRFLFRTMLGMRGYAVIEATDGEQAVLLAESARPDLILMDGSLPRMDGLAATRRIRQLGHIGHVPVVFVSGHAEPAFRVVASEAGCDEYLVKPFGLDQLGGVLDKHLGDNA